MRKVLIVDGTPFSHSSNMGILKSNILKNLPKENIAHVVTSGSIPNAMPNCSSSYLMTKSSVLLQKGKILKHDANEIYPNKSLSKDNSFLNKFVVRIKYKFHNQYVLISELIHLIPFKYNSHLYNYISDFNPDVIITFGGTLNEFNAVVKISKRFNLPFVMYITDDFVNVRYPGSGIVSKFIKMKFKNKFNYCIHNSLSRFVISSTMEDEYSKRYKERFFMINNGIEYTAYLGNKNLIQNYSLKPKRFLYIGTLEPNRWLSLEFFSNVLDEINMDESFDLKLEVYTSEIEWLKYKVFFQKNKSIRYKGSVSFDQVPNIQMNADVLLYVEAFPPSIDINQIKYSLSTKIHQYLASGTPILAFAPDNIGSVNFLKKISKSLIVNQFDSSVLRSSILNLLFKYITFKNQALVARDYAITNFSIDRISNDFLLLINQQLDYYTGNKK